MVTSKHSVSPQYSLDTPNPEFISPDGYDLCVNATCKKVTVYKTNTPVDARLHYVEGSGQYCPVCYQIGSPPKKEVHEDWE